MLVEGKTLNFLSDVIRELNTLLDGQTDSAKIDVFEIGLLDELRQVLVSVRFVDRPGRALGRFVFVRGGAAVPPLWR